MPSSHEGFSQMIAACRPIAHLIDVHSSIAREQDSNARLIAAAPDLLAALQELVLAPNKIRPEKYWDAARLAISKATNN